VKTTQVGLVSGGNVVVGFTKATGAHKLVLARDVDAKENVGRRTTVARLVQLVARLALRRVVDRNALALVAAQIGNAEEVDDKSRVANSRGEEAAVTAVLHGEGLDALASDTCGVEMAFKSRCARLAIGLLVSAAAVGEVAILISRARSGRAIAILCSLALAVHALQRSATVICGKGEFVTAVIARAEGTARRLANAAVAGADPPSIVLVLTGVDAKKGRVRGTALAAQGSKVLADARIAGALIANTALGFLLIRVTARRGGGGGAGITNADA